MGEADRGGRGDRRPQPGQVPQGGWSSWRRRSKRRCQRAGNGNEEGPRQVCLPRSLRNLAIQSRLTTLQSTNIFPAKFQLICGANHFRKLDLQRKNKPLFGKKKKKKKKKS